MGRKRGRARLLELGGYWLAQRFDAGGGGTYYAYWNDPGTGRDRRVSLKTTKREEAETAFAAFVVTRPQRTAGAEIPPPRAVLLSAVLEHYLRNRASKKRSGDTAERAVAYLQEFLFDAKKLHQTIKADQFGLDLQTEFVRWLAAERGHSAATISRLLNPIAAAMRFAAKEQAVEDIAAPGRMRSLRLMSSAPDVRFYAGWVAETADIAPPQKREWIPEIEQMARFIECIREDHAFRFWMILLNTWARSEAIMDLDLKRQVRERTGILDLNPPNRRQNAKRRPVIRLTKNLALWRAHWLEEGEKLVAAGQLAKEHVGRPIFFRGRLVDNCKRAIQLASARWMFAEAGFSRDRIDELTAERMDAARWQAVGELRAAGFEPITPRVGRSFMATQVTNLQEIEVPEGQIEIWMGHKAQTTTQHYQLTSRTYLAKARDATDLIIEKIAGHCRRSLVPVAPQAELPLEPAPRV